MKDRGGESKYLEARVEGLLDNQAVTELLMKKMVVKVVTTPGGEILEEATFQSQVTLSWLKKAFHRIFLHQITRGLVRRSSIVPGQPPSFEVRVRRPGPGVAAELKVSLLGREIEDSPQRLASRNQVLPSLFQLLGNIYSRILRWGSQHMALTALSLIQLLEIWKPPSCRTGPSGKPQGRAK